MRLFAVCVLFCLAGCSPPPASPEPVPMEATHDASVNIGPPAPRPEAVDNERERTPRSDARPVDAAAPVDLENRQDLRRETHLDKLDATLRLMIGRDFTSAGQPLMMGNRSRYYFGAATLTAPDEAYRYHARWRLDAATEPPSDASMGGWSFSESIWEGGVDEASDYADVISVFADLGHGFCAGTDLSDLRRATVDMIDALPETEHTVRTAPITTAAGYVIVAEYRRSPTSGSESVTLLFAPDWDWSDVTE